VLRNDELFGMRLGGPNNQDLHLDFHKNCSMEKEWQRDSMTFFVVLKGTRDVSLGTYGLLRQTAGDFSVLSANTWHAGTASTGVILFGYIDRTRDHATSDARGGFGEVLEDNGALPEDYVLEHSHCRPSLFQETLRNRFSIEGVD
jgi:hypothetical protein